MKQEKEWFMDDSRDFSFESPSEESVETVDEMLARSRRNYPKYFEMRIAAYLEMHPVIVVAALNQHYKDHSAFNQAKFFDLKCLTEALRRSSIDVSDFLPDGQASIFNSMGAVHHWGKKNNWPAKGPFRLENSKSGRKIVLDG